MASPVWKELRPRAEGESAALLGRPRTASAAPVPKANAATSATGDSAVEEQDWMYTGFTVREVGPQAIRFWLGLQCVSLLFSFLLWNEVSVHLSEFEDVVAQQCRPEHRMHGVCVGPMWNVSAWEDTVLPAAHQGSLPERPHRLPEGSKYHSWTFSTHSLPPTFLLAVDPVSIAENRGDEPAAAPVEIDEQEAGPEDVAWSLEVVRTDPPQATSSFHRYHRGQEAFTYEDLSAEAMQTLAARGRLEWRATLHARFPLRRRVRYVAFVEDATTPHLAEVHASSQCAFGRSWKAFNMQHEGHGHRALTKCQSLLGFFLLVGAAAVYMVNAELEQTQGRTQSTRFHWVVAAKFFLQDVPQQVCIVLYLLGWYEASGLKCQLCLFNPQYCREESALHLTNLVALTTCLLSSMANQLLIRPAFKRRYTEDDHCMMFCIRGGSLCIATLPFTTGVCVATSSVLPLPDFFHFLAAIPCAIGWLTVGGAVFVPILACCDEDFDI